MRFFRYATSPIALAALSLSLVSCGGGGGATGGTTSQPPQNPAVALSASSISFGNQNVNTSSSPQTVTLSNTGNAALDNIAISVGGTDASDFSDGGTTCGSSLSAGGNCNIAVTFTPTTTGSLTASLSIKDNATDSPQTVSLTGTGVNPTLTISPTSATVLLGAQQSFALNASATCKSSLFGDMTVSGSGTTYTATYAVPEAIPSAWTDTLTCTGANGNQTQASAAVTLQYPMPTIISVSPNTLGTLFTLDTSETGGIPVYGSGFLNDGNVSMTPDPYNLCPGNLVSWNELTMGFVVSYTDFAAGCSSGNPGVWNPGFHGVTYSDPTGHGGGTSNVGHLAFLGDQNLLAFNKSDAFLLDSAENTIWKFKLDGSSDGKFTFTNGTGLAIAVDNTTGDVVLFTDSNIQTFNPVTDAHTTLYDTGAAGLLHGGTAKDGWAVFSQYGSPVQGAPNILGCVNLQTGAVNTVSVYGAQQNFPWDFQLTQLNGNLTAVVWSFDEGVLSTVAIPSLTVTGSITLPGIATSATLSTHAMQGGWQLQVFNSGPSQGIAVLLSQFDQILVYVNLTTMKETQRVDLAAALKNAGLPDLQSFRLAKDEGDGSVAVAFADPLNDRTVAAAVNSGGILTPLKTTEPFLATGFRESTDGTNLYWGNRKKFVITPKQ